MFKRFVQWFWIKRESWDALFVESFFQGQTSDWNEVLRVITQYVQRPSAIEALFRGDARWYEVREQIFCKSPVVKAFVEGYDGDLNTMLQWRGGSYVADTVIMQIANRYPPEMGANQIFERGRQPDLETYVRTVY
jgi:hypothetical protein